ncbi:MAG: glucosamine-6-phosphate deaminase [Verrucomicrobiota bacterium]
MNIHIEQSTKQMGITAAAAGAQSLRQALDQNNEASIIVATGASQFEMLAALVNAPEIDWTKVTVFHLDEYVGLPESHPASFRRYLRERFTEKLPATPKAFHYVNGETNPNQECTRLDKEISSKTVDVAFIGIGENGHLAFNDPPADFETDQPFLVVTLDEACRRQQFGEGWFPTLDDVPARAISMSIRQILKSRHIICTVPDRRKAEAVHNAVTGPVTPDVPASILQSHENCDLFLDNEAASLLPSKPNT